MNANSNVGIHEIKTDIDKAMNLSKYQIDLYLSPAGIGQLSTSLMKRIIKTWLFRVHTFVLAMVT